MPRLMSRWTSESNLMDNQSSYHFSVCALLKLPYPTAHTISAPLDMLFYLPNATGLVSIISRDPKICLQQKESSLKLSPWESSGCVLSDKGCLSVPRFSVEVTHFPYLRTPRNLALQKYVEYSDTIIAETWRLWRSSTKRVGRGWEEGFMF